LMAKRLKRLFEVRHIICHELPSKPAYMASEVTDFLNEAVRFASAFENVLSFELYGLTPLTQTEMNIEAARKLRERDSELEKLIIAIPGEVSLVNGELSALEESQEKWLSFRKSHCDFLTILNKGGTIRSLLWSSKAKAMTEHRIEELGVWLEHRANL